MGEISIKNYQLFENAKSTTEALKDSTININISIDKQKINLSNESIFMGPISENCCEAIDYLQKINNSFVEDLSTLSNIITTINGNYKEGDSQSLDELLGISTSSDNGVLTASVLGSSYNLVNTQANVLDYYKNVIQGNKVYQQSGNYGDQCLGFAYNHAWGIYTNDTTIKASNCKNGTPVGKNFSRYTTNSEKDFLAHVYNQISQGKPCVIQVIGSKNRQSRHYVTCIGLKNNVNSASELKATDLLIVDSYDGKIENVVAKGSSGDGRYLIKGTDTRNFKSGKNSYNYGYELYYIK